MKTLNFALPSRGPILHSFIILLLFCTSVATVSAQAGSPAPQAATKGRPEASDAASLKLIRNYLTVTGGAKAYNKLRNVVARGTLSEAGQIKAFELIELQDGRRHLSLSWRHLGRDYKEIFVFDGLETWRQQLEPKLKDPVNYSGQESTHFASQRWLLQPFVLPSIAHYAFKYQGGAKVGGRPCHVVVGYGKKDERSWFYFDQEKFLLLRWGGFGELAGVREYLDYQASKFKKVGGVLLPSEIKLLAENSAFGNIQFETILANQAIHLERFSKPKSRTPVLRQRSVPGN